MSISAIRIAAAKALHKKGMSQASIARQLGVAQAAVSKYLSNRYSKKIAKVEKLIESKGLHREVVGLINAKKTRREILRRIDQIASSNYLLKEVLKIS